MSKYAPALLQLAIVLVGALAQLTGRLTLVDALQLIPLAANVALVYVVPLLRTTGSTWKTGIAVIDALVAAGIPFAVAHHITAPGIAIVLLAGLQVAAAHIGVQIRNDAAVTATPAAVAAVPAQEPPTTTSMVRTLSASGGEMMGDAR